MMKALCIIGLLFVLTGCAEKFVEKDINAGSHSLHCISYTKGGPTIVLDCGVGETYERWIPLLNKLKEKGSVFAYNRGGYPKSGEGPFPRDSKQIAIELNTLLENAKAEKPYILVGHSLGAANMEMFISAYPDKVKGAVLLDPPPLSWLLGNEFADLKKLAEEQTNAFTKSAEEMEKSNEPGAKEKGVFFRTLASEHKEMFSSSAEQINAIETFGAVPLTVIASTISNPQFGNDAEAFQKFWIKESEKVVGKSGKGKFIIAENSRHHIHIDREELVIKEILEYLNK